MAEWIIESFAVSHERADFSCGKESLDDFIRARATQYEKRKLGKTFVAVPTGKKQVVGYYTLAAGAIAFEHLPSVVAGKLPKHPVPVALIARLAVDTNQQGKGLGEILLLDAFQRILNISASLGIHAVTVDALDDSAVAFYRKYGFSPLLDRPRQLFLPITTIASALN